MIIIKSENMDAIINSVWRDERASNYLKQASYLMEVFTEESMPVGTISFFKFSQDQQIPEAVHLDSDMLACYSYIRARTITSNTLFQDMAAYMQQIRTTADNLRLLDLADASAYSGFSQALDLINQSRRLLASDEAERDSGDVANRTIDLESRALLLVETALKSTIIIGEAYLLKGVLMEIGLDEDYEEKSIECYDMCLSMVPADSLLDFLARTRKINLLLHKDQDYIEDLYRIILENIDQLISDHPLKTEGYKFKAELSKLCKDYATAICSLNRTLDLDLNSLGTHLSLCSLLMTKGDFDEALKEIDKAIEINPEFIPAYISKGKVLMLKGDYKEALTLADTFLNSTKDLRLPYLRSFYFLKSEIFYSQGKFEEAVNILDEGLEHSEALFEDARTFHFLNEKIRLCLSEFYRLKEKGQISEARELLTKTKKIAESKDTLMYSPRLFDTLSEVLDTLEQDG